MKKDLTFYIGFPITAAAFYAVILFMPDILSFTNLSVAGRMPAWSEVLWAANWSVWLLQLVLPSLMIIACLLATIDLVKFAIHCLGAKDGETIVNYCRFWPETNFEFSLKKGIFLRMASGIYAVATWSVLICLFIKGMFYKLSD